jgi:hypothetical protein
MSCRKVDGGFLPEANAFQNPEKSVGYYWKTTIGHIEF